MPPFMSEGNYLAGADVKAHSALAHARSKVALTLETGKVRILMGSMIMPEHPLIHSLHIPASVIACDETHFFYVLWPVGRIAGACMTS